MPPWLTAPEGMKEETPPSCQDGMVGADRVSFFSGNFFTGPYPDDVDAIFMSHVIHDWNDEACLQILEHCYEALPTGSPVLVQEFLLDDDKTSQLLGVFQWFGLLSSTSGDQRTSAEVGTLLSKAGFAEIETRAVYREQSIVIGWKK
ncbi:MAG: methyltransferase [Candidatus Latescibacterota bacterium]|nr:methyltransferase [Candidatus Latescibacterota bacterium]